MSYLDIHESIRSYLWSYWEIDRAIGRFMTFSFFAADRLFYLDTEGVDIMESVVIYFCANTQFGHYCHCIELSL